MKRFIILLLLIQWATNIVAQVNLAAVVNSPSIYSPEIAGGKKVNGVTFKNIASISDAIIKLKGEDWYINNILDNESYPKKISYSIVFYSDSIEINQQDRLIQRNNDLFSTLCDVCKYLYTHHCNMYIPILTNQKVVDKVEYIKLIHNYINKKNEFFSSYAPNEKIALHYIFNGFIGTIHSTTKFYYNKYRTKEIEKGKIPLSHIDWIKSQIDYYMNLHIDSSLDYGIDNSAFMIN